jgi:hypothetical protein
MYSCAGRENSDLRVASWLSTYLSPRTVRRWRQWSRRGAHLLHAEVEEGLLGGLAGLLVGGVRHFR